MDVSMSNAFAYIKEVTEKIMAKEVSEMAKKSQKDMKQKHVYDLDYPTQYVRTYEFLDANDTKIGKPLSLNINIELFTPTTLSWMESGHRSWVDNSNQNKNIAHWLNYGNYSPLFSHRERNYIDPTRDLIDRNIKATMVRAYRSYGIMAT